MTQPVLPIQTILFQVIFLLVMIALESRVFHSRLRITRKTSVEYATSLNLLATIVGWLAFFIGQSQLPQPIRTQLISFIFFDRFLSPAPAGLNLIVISIGITVFFAAFVIKLKGLELLQALLQSSKEPRQAKPSVERRRPKLSDRLYQATLRTDPNHAVIVLLANAYSHSAILVILFIRFLFLYLIV